ncbi:Rossmann-like domain-containing protein [Desulfitobacterium chlororespirans]|uniref:Heavy-metal chelation n=1 Tax=Desulfitobacterium chlororespirans DSM 11544 TaxID=1121395 RepID=A0A1M7UZV6_9FIRM|nr:DUF364 domain-containing protein [Desulfitobacterium chlororespirans]SHN88561.1 hypothetical protein SAMN02745215_05405 [Desulfitobacterium chlororespirans DSM 11544]
MWELYDELIEAVDPDLRIEDCLVGVSWIMVRSRATGLAMVMASEAGSVRGSGSLVGKRVRELAEYIKSWNTLEAGIGLAAINSVLNTGELVERYSGLGTDTHAGESVFVALRPQLRGKKVAVIGHFPGLEQLKEWPRLTILERSPQEGDLPDPACEYVLPEQDYVFITSTTLINKTLPRLLELSRQAKVIMVGPSTPLYPGLFARGIELWPVPCWRMKTSGHMCGREAWDRDI